MSGCHHANPLLLHSGWVVTSYDALVTTLRDLNPRCPLSSRKGVALQSLLLQFLAQRDRLNGKLFKSYLSSEVNLTVHFLNDILGQMDRLTGKLFNFFMVREIAYTVI